MDIDYIIIGLVFLITGITILIYKFRYHTIKEDEDHVETDFNGTLLIFTLGFIVLGGYLIWNEIEKII